MIDELVRTGIARFEYRHYLGHGTASLTSALATECAGDQGQWWEFHDHYMTARDFTRGGAVQLAASRGLDTAQFQQCLDSPARLAEVEAIHTEARAAGVNRTPTIRVNGEGAATSAGPLIEQVLELASRLGGG